MKTKSKTVKIYLVTCTRGQMMSEQHRDTPSLSGWGRNTEKYEGYDDGGRDYDLPPGFYLAETVDEMPAIFHEAKDEPFACDLVRHSSGRPQVISMRHGCPVLSPSVAKLPAVTAFTHTVG